MAITPEKLEDASLAELIRAFDILKKAELGIKGERVKISGLVEYLTELERKENLEPVGGVKYIQEILNSVPTAANAEYYAKIDSV